MRLRLLTAALALHLLVSFGCGDDGETTTGTPGGGSGSPTAVNECEQDSAEDMTGLSSVTITFPQLSYTPACVRVKAGSQVTFKGDFVAHPLVGGEVRDAMKDRDLSSPITETKVGTEATFTLTTPGTFPYYCDVHATIGMYGAIYVE